MREPGKADDHAPDDDRVDDLLYAIDDDLDPEAQLLCALLWGDGADDPAVRYVCGELSSADFNDPVYGHIFDLIAEQVTAGRPCDPTSINSRIVARGRGSVPADALRRVLLALSGLNALPVRTVYYADQLLGTWYRRQYVRMAETIRAIGLRADETELFPRLVEHGRRQRRAAERLAGFLGARPR
ncbi:hypothetical protein OS127_05305 [Corynebacterium sp. P6129]|uniref:DnaB-like helicase N-terminal domain-containing protein n=1 Tax=Corynebacterium antarcticum TaxID=2800405 RepID=UPI002260A8CC|nr:DnaB-like helicase N-terminal domain-containing protein [Corynebacterium antarcticum]MCX7491944.1 hypothetical protein [Corynebacterium antarcticum]